MEFAYLRTILEDLHMELGIMFERGLAQSERQEASLRACAARLADSGMENGSDAVNALCKQLQTSRLDTHWKSNEAALLLARLWKYIGLCMRRLEFLEAQADMQG